MYFDGVYLDRHHVFGGANRRKAEAMGLWVWVRPELHRVGEGSIHRCRELDLQLKKWAERICLEVYDMSEDDFIREFGRNYLLSEADYNTEPPTVSIDELRCSSKSLIWQQRPYQNVPNLDLVDVYD